MFYRERSLYWETDNIPTYPKQKTGVNLELKHLLRATLW